MDAVERLGFVLEGRLRRSVKYHDRWFDVNTYSVVPEDLEVKGRYGKRNRRAVCFDCGETFSNREDMKKLKKKNVQEYEESEKKTKEVSNA